MLVHHLPTENLRSKTGEIDLALSAHYGKPEWSARLDGVSELVLTILSQHTSDRNSGAAFDRLYAHYKGDWERVMAAPVAELAEVIRSAGLSNIKAPRIQQVLLEIKDRTSVLSLDFLPDLPLDEAQRWLTSLNGIGPKTAACVLMFSYGLPVMPVDTHVHRVSKRLGLVGPRVGADTAHRLLAALVPPERAYPFHINLIRHGRQTCKAPTPRCSACPVTSWCDYYKQTFTATDPEEPHR